MKKNNDEAFEKDKCFLGREKERCLHFHELSPSKTTRVNNTNENLEIVSNKSRYSKEQNRKVRTIY